MTDYCILVVVEDVAGGTIEVSHIQPSLQSEHLEEGDEGSESVVEAKVSAVVIPKGRNFVNQQAHASTCELHSAQKTNKN